MVAVLGEFAPFAHRGDRQAMRRRSRKLYRPRGIPGGDDTGHAHLFGPNDTVLDDLRRLAATQAHVGDVDALLHAVIERLDEIAEPTTGEDSADMDLRRRSEAADAATAGNRPAGDNPGAMRTVTDRIDGPGRFIIADDAGAARYAAQIAMGWRRAGIDNRDFHAGTIIARGQAIKTHRPLTPAQQLPAGEVAQRRTERSHDNPVDTIGNELRTIEPESPVVDLRFDEDRPDGIGPFALNAQRDAAVGVGDTLGRPHAAEHIDFGVRQRAGLARTPRTSQRSRQPTA